MINNRELLYNIKLLLLSPPLKHNLFKCLCSILIDTSVSFKRISTLLFNLLEMLSIKAIISSLLRLKLA